MQTTEWKLLDNIENFINQFYRKDKEINLKNLLYRKKGGSAMYATRAFFFSST